VTESASNPANRQIARAAGTVMAAFIVSQISGLFRSVLVLNTFGASPEMDSFLAANQVTDTLFQLVAGGALASSFIPAFTALLVQGDRQGAWRLASAIANLIMLILSLLAALAAFFAPQLVRYTLAAGLATDPYLEALTINLLRLMMPAAVIFGLSGLIMGILNANQVFLVPALTPSMYNFGLIAGAVVFAPTMGIYGLAVGVLLGAVLHLGLQIPTLLRQKGSYFLTLGLDQPAVREVGRLIGPRLFGLAVLHINSWVNIILAGFQPEGSITAIKSAFTLMLMPQVAIAQSVAVAAMPTISAQHARGELQEVRSSISASLRGVLLLSLPASLGLILLRRPLVVALYQRGAFDERSTELFTWALLWYAAGLVGHSLVEVLARAFYALHDTKTPVKVGALAMGLNIAFSLAFVALFNFLGWAPHGGLALANSLATTLEMAWLLVLMSRRLNGLDGKKVLRAALKGAAATGLMGLVLLGWLHLTAPAPAWLVLLGGLFVGGASYAAAALALGISEARGAVRQVLRRLRRQAS
jgi:putative peptidoglycan lipid II flippase